MHITRLFFDLDTTLRREISSETSISLLVLLSLTRFTSLTMGRVGQCEWYQGLLRPPEVDFSDRWWQGGEAASSDISTSSMTGTRRVVVF